MLIKNGADFNATGYNGMTLLHAAAGNLYIYIYINNELCVIQNQIQIRPRTYD